MERRNYDNILERNRGRHIRAVETTSINHFIAFLKNNATLTAYQEQLDTCSALGHIPLGLIQQHYKLLLPQFGSYLTERGADDGLAVGSATNYLCQLKNALVREFGESPIIIGTVRKLVGEYWNKEYGELVKSVKKVFWEECQLNGRRPYNPPTAGKMDDVRGTATTIDHY